MENLNGIGTEVPAMPCRLRVYGSVEVLVVRGSGVLGFGRVRMCGRTLLWVTSEGTITYVVTSALTLAVFLNRDSKPACSLDRSFDHALTDAWWFSSFYLG